MADQQFKFKFAHEGEAIDYTPVSAVAAGVVIFRGGITGVTKRAIAANEMGALAIVGVYDVVMAAEIFADGALVYWDADADPVGGTAGTGAASAIAGGNTLIGRAVGARVATDLTVRVLLQQRPLAA